MDGHHDRTQHAALLYALDEARHSGVLEVRRDAEHRRIYLLGGAPVWTESNLDEESLQHTLVAAGLVPRSIASAILDELEPGQDPAEALLNSEMLSAEALEAHLALHVERTFTASLAWDRGEWSFRPCPGLRASAVDPSLRLHVPALRALWHGVCRHVPDDAPELLGFTRGEGQLLHQEVFDRVFPALGVHPALEDLSRTVRLGPTVDELVELFADRSEELSRLLWLLHTIGALTIEGLERSEPLIDWSGDETSEPDAAIPEPGERRSVDVFVIEEDDESVEEEIDQKQMFQATTAGDESPQAQHLRAAHRARMGRDYYTFIDCRPDSNRADLMRSFRRFEDRWKQEASRVDLPQEVRRMAQDLLRATRLVWRTLSDGKRRKAYNTRLKRGTAQVVRGAVDPTPPGGGS